MYFYIYICTLNDLSMVTLCIVFFVLRIHLCDWIVQVSMRNGVTLERDFGLQIGLHREIY